MEAVGRERARQLGRDVFLDSAGTAGWHEGKAPDPRTVRVGEAAGFALAGLRARKVRREDFAAFDLMLAADRGHLDQLRAMAPSAHAHKLRPFLGEGEDLPDPYYGTDTDFDEVLRLVIARWARWQGELGEF